MDQPGDRTLTVFNIMAMLSPISMHSEVDDLGLQLGYSAENLSAMFTHVSDMEERLKCLINSWLKLKDHNPTWRMLIEALKNLPDPGPSIAAYIIESYSTLSEKEDDEKEIVIEAYSMTDEMMPDIRAPPKEINDRTRELEANIRATDEERAKAIKAKGDEEYWKEEKKKEYMTYTSVESYLGECRAEVNRLEPKCSDMLKYYDDSKKRQKQSEAWCKSAEKLLMHTEAKYEEACKSESSNVKRLGAAMKQQKKVNERATKSKLACDEDIRKHMATMDNFTEKLKNSLKCSIQAAISSVRQLKAAKVEEKKKWESGKSTGSTIGKAAAAASIASIFLAPLTGGLSLIVAASAAGAAIGGFVYSTHASSYMNECAKNIDGYDSMIGSFSSLEGRVSDMINRVERKNI